MAIPTVSQEYTPGACRNWRNLMRLHPSHKMRTDSPALHAEEFRVPNQTCKELRFPWWNTRESPRILSQDEQNTDVTSGMQNILVYPKSKQDEAHLHCIGSIAKPRSTSYTTSGLTFFRKNPEIHWDTHLKSRGTSISVKQLEESSVYTISSGDETWFPVFKWRDKPTFHKHLKRSFPSGIYMWEGPCVLCFKWNGPQDALTRKKVRFPCRVLKAVSSFISQDERMSESTVETIEKALGHHLIWTRGFTSLWHLERLVEISASKVDDAWLF